MKISHFPINLCIALFLCSFNASSAIVTFNFEGFVSGVENEEQGETLRHLGCEWLQGYLYGRPMAADDFLRHYSDTQFNR